MFCRITRNTKIILQKSKIDSNQLIRIQLILDGVNLIKQMSRGGIKTSLVENFQNNAYSRLESIRTLLKTTYVKMTIQVESPKNSSEGVFNASSKINYFEGIFSRILPKNISVLIFQNLSRKSLRPVERFDQEAAMNCSIKA